MLADCFCCGSACNPQNPEIPTCREVDLEHSHFRAPHEIQAARAQIQKLWKATKTKRSLPRITFGMAERGV